MSKENWIKVTGRLSGIHIPGGIDFYTNENEKVLKIHINQPEADLQDNISAFEAWALLLYIKKKYKVILSFKQIDWNGTLTNHLEEEGRYKRFLYRAWKFDEQMAWFSISEENRDIVDLFKAEFLQLKNHKQLLNNIPEGEAEVSKSESKLENHIENTFVRHEGAKKMLKHIVKEQDETNLENLHNQLPNGLFKGNRQKDVRVEDSKKIFPTGYFDIWGISKKDELCLFELKVADTKGKGRDNTPAGIISQLFFYANYCQDIFMDKNYNRNKTKFRGYDELLTACEKGISQIKAYFLAPKYHGRIEDNDNIVEIENCLNENSPKIQYKFLKYNYDQIKPFVDELKESIRNSKENDA